MSDAYYKLYKWFSEMREQRLGEFTITHDGQPYRDHWLLFIDILGYSPLMRSDDEAKKTAILELQARLMASNKEGHSKKLSNTLFTKPLTALLSDTIVYSFPVQELLDCKNRTAFVGAYNLFIKKIQEVHALMLNNGMLIRGALTIGKITNHCGMAYGEGLAIANDLQKAKKKPFIYFDEKMVSRLTQYLGDQIQDSLREDTENGGRYFDYLDSAIPGNLGDTRPKLFARIDTHVGQINSNLVATAKTVAHEKWCEIADYYDQKIVSLNKQIAGFPLTGTDLYKGGMVDRTKFDRQQERVTA